jgi:SlyX protein
MIVQVGEPSHWQGRIASNTGMATSHDLTPDPVDGPPSASDTRGGGVDPWPDIDARLTELEVKASYTDDLVDTLNAIVAQQQQQIDRLIREVQQLRQQSGEASATPRNLRDELPPHY